MHDQRFLLDQEVVVLGIITGPDYGKAGKGFADPAYDLSVDWLAAHRDIKAAERQHRDKAAPSCILIINGSMRSDQTCPGEMSKTFRLLSRIRETVMQDGVETDVLDLSLLASEYGRHIHPCKGCVSTAMPLCHWPCSCYPNHGLNQTNDWMAELYPRFVAAHGIFIICPVH